MTNSKAAKIEQKYQLIFNNIQIPYYEAALDGTILDVSPSIQKISQYNREDLIGMSLLDIYSDPSERQHLIDSLVADGEISDYEIKAKDKDGSIKILSLCARLIKDETEVPVKIIGSIQDITQRKKAEKQLRESELRYRQLFESTSEIQLFIDIHGQILNTNLKLVEGIDYTEQELQRMKIHDLVPEEYLPGVQDFLLEIQEGRNSSGFMAVLNKKGQRFVFSYEASIVRDDRGQPTNLIAVRAKNVTDRVMAEQAMRKSEQLFNNFMDNYPYAVNIKEISGPFVWGNKAWQDWVKTTGPAKEVKGYLDYTDPELSQLFDQEDREVRLSQTSRIFSSEVTKDGKRFHFERIKFPIKDDDGGITTRGSIFIDITEQAEFRQKLQELSLTDQVTGLPNRKALFEEYQLDDKPKAVFLIDLDRFKQINSTYGREVGDEMMNLVAERIQDCLSPEDYLVRLEGAEFAVVLKQRDQHQAIQIADRITQHVDDFYRINELNIQISASTGIAFYPGDGLDIPVLLKNANIAVSSLAPKGNGYRVFNRTMFDEITRTNKILNELRVVLDSDQEQLQVYFQPIVDHTKKVIGAEALIRWHHPYEGVIMPGMFIDLAEETGLIAQLTDLVIKRVSSTLKRWKDNKLYITMNISTIDLSEEDFLSRFERMVNGSQVDKQLMRIEITESHVMENPDRAFQNINNMHNRGIKVLIDDFGTGHSSLSYLQRFPKGTTLKIDRSFIVNLPDDDTNHQIVKTIMNLASSLDMEVVVEGVEEDSHYTILKDMGCRKMQGFNFSRPLPVDEFERKYVRKL